ncbi:MAG TPA: hypothetical protein VFP40_04945 [Terriglobales bacterium]|nr:hypothetical protein [Terriglobales bacterium]
MAPQGFVEEGLVHHFFLLVDEISWNTGSIRKTEFEALRIDDNPAVVTKITAPQSYRLPRN